MAGLRHRIAIAVALQWTCFMFASSFSLALQLPTIYLASRPNINDLRGRIGRGILLRALPSRADDEEDLVPVARRRSATEYDPRPRRTEDFDDDDDWGNAEEEEDTAVNNDYSHLFENVLLPNPLLDSMDPDGTADRFPELFSDGNFWRDMVLLILFLDFLSAVGPQSNPFPDLPWFY
jgi:hypothetical protein